MLLQLAAVGLAALLSEPTGAPFISCRQFMGKPPAVIIGSTTRASFLRLFDHLQNPSSLPQANAC